MLLRAGIYNFHLPLQADEFKIPPRIPLNGGFYLVGESIRAVLSGNNGQMAGLWHVLPSESDSVSGVSMLPALALYDKTGQDGMAIM